MKVLIKKEMLRLLKLRTALPKKRLLRKQPRAIKPRLPLRAALRTRRRRNLLRMRRQAPLRAKMANTTKEGAINHYHRSRMVSTVSMSKRRLRATLATETR